MDIGDGDTTTRMAAVVAHGAGSGGPTGLLRWKESRDGRREFPARLRIHRLGVDDIYARFFRPFLASFSPHAPRNLSRPDFLPVSPWPWTSEICSADGYSRFALRTHSWPRRGASFGRGGYSCARERLTDRPPLDTLFFRIRRNRRVAEFGSRLAVPSFCRANEDLDVGSTSIRRGTSYGMTLSISRPIGRANLL